MNPVTLIARARGLVYAAVFVGLWGWLALAARNLDYSMGGPLPAMLRPAGLVLLSLGAVLAATCVGLFIGPGRGTPAPFDPPREFVASGPYRWTRNPMYLGAAAVLLGLGLWWQSPGAASLSAVLLILAHGFVLLVEEPSLTRRFGESYLEYRSRVPRWIPRRPRRLP